MTIPYTYLLKHTPSGKVYYGCRFAKGCSPIDFWNKYFTSSKHIKRMIQEDGVNSFKFEIRQTFSSIDKCRNWESKVLKKLDVLKRQHLFINKSDNISVSREAASRGAKSKKGMKYNWSLEGLNNIRNANTGRVASDDTRIKLSLAAKGIKRGPNKKPATQESRLNKRLGHLGKSSGMLGKTHNPCSCILCGHITKVPNLKSHYKYKHTN